MIAVVPVFNHARTVAEVVAGLRAFGATVLVVDDGSTDGSGDAAAAAGGEVHRLPVNRGKGEALRVALAIARDRGCARALTCDADG
ncbi:MAG: glycosyltransferase, partial [Planctomycetes bacterium]|nr:glycosyltransferase [Planctomycetota bacterium]